MSIPARSLKLTAENYLEFEQSGQVRHEYVAGQLFAMVGASAAHNVIALNIASIVKAQLRGSQCRTYMSDMKIRIKSLDTFYYPDVMVTCEKFVQNSLFQSEPAIVFEVLSPSTMHIDRREKFMAYQQISSLREYIVVHQNEPEIELFCKDKSGSWERFDVNNELILSGVQGCGLSLKLADIYEGIDFASTSL